MSMPEFLRLLAGLAPAEVPDAGTDKEGRNDQGYTPLMQAVLDPAAGEEELRRLIAQGADVNAVSTPPPPLAQQIAAMQAAGLDTSFLDQRNETPAGDSVLALAVEHAPLSKIKLLVENGADVKWSSSHGYSLVLTAVYRQARTEDAERRAILEYLLDAGAPLDGKSKYGETAVTVAARGADVELVKLLLDRGADASVLRWGHVFRAIAFGTLDDLAAVLRKKPRLKGRDCWGRTPFLFAVHCGKLDMARLLLEHGAARSATSHYGAPAMAYAIEGNHGHVLQWLLDNGWDVQQAVSTSNTSPLRHAVNNDSAECVQRLIAAGANVYEENEYGFDLMHEAASPEVVELLHAAGLALDSLPSEQRLKLLPVNGGQPFVVSPEDYLAFRDPRFGRSNPDEMGNPFWNELVRLRCGAYAASERFGDPRVGCGAGGPVWCCNRFGQSLTRLPSGQSVEIGGEHEDSYDADFCIYNDVVVHDGQGRFRIFGYPQEIFPPTDFHSATFLAGALYIIGGLGYRDDRRAGQTPVFRLDCTTWSMEAVPSAGDGPGWISRHRARAEADGTILVWGGKIWDGKDLVGNERAFRFDPRTGRWNAATFQ